jgi:hypothetical protein
VQDWHRHCVALVLLTHLVVAQAFERENLTDLREVNVAVTDRAADAEAADLTRRALLAEVERRLEKRRVPFWTSRHGADLYIHVSTHLWSTGVFVDYARVSL